MMEVLRRLTLGRPHEPSRYPRVPNDTVVPMFYFDDTPLLWRAINCRTLRFSDSLDADKLGGSLSRLLEREGWRKLGGRIRLNVRLYIAVTATKIGSLTQNPQTEGAKTRDPHPRDLHRRRAGAELPPRFPRRKNRRTPPCIYATHPYRRHALRAAKPL